MSTIEINLGTIYTLVHNGTVFRIRTEMAGVKDWYKPPGLIDTLFVDSPKGKNPWTTKYRWRADIRISHLRATEKARIARELNTWESVREEVKH